MLEVSGEKLFLLTSSGEIKEVRAPKESIMIGQEYISKSKLFDIDLSIFKSRSLIAIMLLVFIMLPTSLSYTYFKPHGYINIDINPSLEIAYNIFDRVIDVKSINSDGKKMIDDNLQINNLRTSDAVENVITKAENLGYIKSNESNLVLITVTSKDENDVLKYEDDSFKSDNYDISILKAGDKEHSEAVDKGISTGEIVINNMIKNEKSSKEKDKLIKKYKKFANDLDDEIDTKYSDESDDKEKPNKKEEKKIDKVEQIRKEKEEKEGKEELKLQREEEKIEKKIESENSKSEEGSSNKDKFKENKSENGKKEVNDSKKKKKK